MNSFQENYQWPKTYLACNQGISRMQDGTVLQGRFEHCRFVEGIAFIPCENGSYVFRGRFTEEGFLGEKKFPNGDYSCGLFKCTQAFTDIRKCFENLVLHGCNYAAMRDGLLFSGVFVADVFVSGTITIPERNTCFTGYLTVSGFVGVKCVLNQEFSTGTFKSTQSPLSDMAGIRGFVESLVLDGDNCSQALLNQSHHMGKFRNGIYVN